MILIVNECSLYNKLKFCLFLIFVKKQSQELTRVNPDRNIFSINVELASTFLLYRGLVHHHHRVFKSNFLISICLKPKGNSLTFQRQP